jgi:D-alanyl-D-alanine carboxypeptidase
MNRKAASLGMLQTHFNDATGLSSENVATARDLARMVQAAAGYPLIREFTTTASHSVEIGPSGRVLGFNNTNSLVRGGQWDITLSKTGFIREAGKCLVMLANIVNRPVVIVLLDSYGKLSRIADAQRVKYWLETGESLALPTASHASVKAKRATHRVRGSFAVVDRGQGQGAPPVASRAPTWPRGRFHWAARQLARASRCRLALLCQQFAGVCPRLGGDFVAAEHARELLDPRAGGKSRQLGRNRVSLTDLGDAVVLVRARRDLRQMGDAEHLPP